MDPLYSMALMRQTSSQSRSLMGGCLGFVLKKSFSEGIVPSLVSGDFAGPPKGIFKEVFRYADIGRFWASSRRH